MNDNFTKVLVMAVLGGVAKALFAQPTVHNHYPEPKSTSTEIDLKGDA